MEFKLLLHPTTFAIFTIAISWCFAKRTQKEYRCYSISIGPLEFCLIDKNNVRE